MKTGLAHGGLYVIDARVSPTTVRRLPCKIHLGPANRAPRAQAPGDGISTMNFEGEFKVQVRPTK